MSVFIYIDLFTDNHRCSVIQAYKGLTEEPKKNKKLSKKETNSNSLAARDITMFQVISNSLTSFKIINPMLEAAISKELIKKYDRRIGQQDNKRKWNTDTKTKTPGRQDIKASIILDKDSSPLWTKIISDFDFNALLSYTTDDSMNNNFDTARSALERSSFLLELASRVYCALQDHAKEINTSMKLLYVPQWKEFTKERISAWLPFAERCISHIFRFEYLNRLVSSFFTQIYLKKIIFFLHVELTP